MPGFGWYETLTLVGIVAGPIAAVAITLWIEGRRGVRERRTTIARTLMATRHLPADVAYNGSINLIPIEFNDCPAVMAAWRAYIETVRFHPAPENAQQHDELAKSRQSAMIFAVLSELRYSLSESDIRTSAYASQGFIDRDNLNIAGTAAFIRIANALEGNAQPPPDA